jgi:uncharacterized protein (TIGR02598 family)
MNSPGPKTKSAFSLVEVSLALAIVGIAFTVIIGMLPVGLRQARAATDTTNEARVLAAMTAIVHATEYEKLKDVEKKLHYFDADGGFLEVGGLASASASSGDDLEFKDSHVYQAMIVVSDQPEPGGASYDPLRVSRRVHVLYGRINDKAIAGFNDFESAEDLFGSSERTQALPFRVTPVVVAKMDRIKSSDIN